MEETRVLVTSVSVAEMNPPVVFAPRVRTPAPRAPSMTTFVKEAVALPSARTPTPSPLIWTPWSFSVPAVTRTVVGSVASPSSPVITTFDGHRPAMVTSSLVVNASA